MVFDWIHAIIYREMRIRCNGFNERMMLCAATSNEKVEGGLRLEGYHDGVTRHVAISVLGGQ